jgi:hypothetical protein
MGSLSFKHIAGGLVVAVALAVPKLMPAHVNQPLRHDHLREWSYVKVPHGDPTPLERRLGELAGIVAGRSVQVRCEDFSDGSALEPGGVVQFNGTTPADFTRLRPDVCTAILKFVRAPTSLRFDSAVALSVLAHESFHLKGIKVEAVAECYALQSVPRLARALGASPQQGAAMAIAVWRLQYPTMPVQYRSPACRSGGSLDLHPGGGWPA